MEAMEAGRLAKVCGTTGKHLCTLEDEGRRRVARAEPRAGVLAPGSWALIRVPKSTGTVAVGRRASR